MDDLDALARDLDDAGNELRGNVIRLVRTSTLRTEALAKQFVPVASGFLKSTITPDFDVQADRISGEVGPEASYGLYVERGTRHSKEDWEADERDPASDVEHGTWRTPPQPYMNPAADVVEPQFYAGAEALGGRVLGG